MWGVKHGWVGWIGSGYEEEIINFASYWEWCHFFSSEKQPVIWFPLNWCEIRDEKTDEWEKYTEVLGFFCLFVFCRWSPCSRHTSQTLCIYSHHCTYAVMCCHIDQISMNLCSPAHGHVVYQSALTADPLYYSPLQYQYLYLCSTMVYDYSNN